MSCSSVTVALNNFFEAESESALVYLFSCVPQREETIFDHEEFVDSLPDVTQVLSSWLLPNSIKKCFDYDVFIESLSQVAKPLRPTRKCNIRNPIKGEFPLEDAEGQSLPSITVKIGLRKCIHILSFTDSKKYQRSGINIFRRINVRSSSDCGNYPISVYDPRDRAKIYKGLLKQIRIVLKHMMTQNEVVINCNHGRSRSVIVALGKLV